LTTSVGILFAIYARYWNPADSYVKTVFLFCGYLAVLSLASVLAFSSPPKWKTFWVTYAVFGWSYLVVVMRLGRLLNENVIVEFTPQIGILGGFACAFMALALSAPAESA
jgi:hypothetical protein